MSNLAKIQDQYSSAQKKALESLKKEQAWEILMDMCDKIIKKRCDLNTVDIKLADKEFKIEYEARKKAKEMFEAVMGKSHPLAGGPKKEYL